MNVEQIRKRVHEGPMPLVIRLTDGRKFRIPHQDFIAIGTNLVIVLGRNDDSVRIDPLHVVSLDDARLKNGKKKPHHP